MLTAMSSKTSLGSYKSTFAAALAREILVYSVEGGEKKVEMERLLESARVKSIERQDGEGEQGEARNTQSQLESPETTFQVHRALLPDGGNLNKCNDSALVSTTTSDSTLAHLSFTPIITQAHVLSLKRLNSLLLPVAYPESFYRELLTEADTQAVSRMALWDGLCIGGVRGKVEDLPEADVGDQEGNGGSRTQPSKGKRRVRMYLMTLGVLSPFRGVGVGGRLVEWLLKGGDRATEWEVVEVYAHVWEANQEALDWYVKRGFVVEKEVLQGYYRRLRPNGAKVVRWTKRAGRQTSSSNFC